jgi:hypothetical protein
MLVLISGSGVVNDARAVTPQSAPGQEEYSVYAALLKEMFMGKSNPHLVINKYTAVQDFIGSNAKEILERLPPVTRETIEDFKARNTQSSELSDKFGLKVKISFITDKEIKELFEDHSEGHDGWKIFPQKYPGADAIITLSRAGFNADKSQALIFVGYGCGWLCGEGNYLLLVKKDGEWRVEKKSMVWIS